MGLGYLGHGKEAHTTCAQRPDPLTRTQALILALHRHLLELQLQTQKVGGASLIFVFVFLGFWFRRIFSVPEEVFVFSIYFSRENVVDWDFKGYSGNRQVRALRLHPDRSHVHIRQQLQKFTEIHGKCNLSFSLYNS